jgi:hypothetical protein
MMMIMNKLFFSLAILSILLFSCSNEDTSSQESQLQVVTSSEKVFSIDDFYNLGFKKIGVMMFLNLKVLQMLFLAFGVLLKVTPKLTR